MGVCAMLHIPGDHENALSARLHELGSTIVSRWRTQCVYHQPRDPSVEEVSVLQFSTRPEMCFLTSKSLVLEAGLEMVSVFEAMQTHVQRLKVVSEGATFKCGDFLVRIGPLLLNSNASGTMVEVEYSPCVKLGECSELLSEYIDFFLNTSVNPHLQPDCSVYEDCFSGRTQPLPGEFGHQHAAVQFVGMLRGTQMIGGARQSR